VDLNRWLSDTRLVVCVGSGGVGKTTTAAAIGLWGALSGRNVIVLTIDPAKRLANSLGLSHMGGDPTRIDLASLPGAKG
jgi:anion-transporting  ArsA/GET3 family ATPase